jgi:cyclophilin family peptidyl-prolyl cis-trans isomerase
LELRFTALTRLNDPAGHALIESFDGSIPRAAAIAHKPDPGMGVPWVPIIQAYRRISGGDDARTKVALLKNLDPHLAEAEVQSALLGALHDGDRNVRLVAAGLLRKSGNRDIGEDPGPARTTASSLTYLIVTAARRDRTTAIVETTRGTIEIELFREEAPMTVSNFVSLAKQGFYDGTNFMRVIPFSMVQGGDYADGREKRPDYTLRCEINMRPFERGSIGMANAGKDTGAARFFFTLAPQPLLDGKYTCFGRVTSGMQAAERIVPGDRIRHIEIKEDVTMLDYRRF